MTSFFCFYSHRLHSFPKWAFSLYRLQWGFFHTFAIWLDFLVVDLGKKKPFLYVLFQIFSSGLRSTSLTIHSIGFMVLLKTYGFLILVIIFFSYQFFHLVLFNSFQFPVQIFSYAYYLFEYIKHRWCLMTFLFVSLVNSFTLPFFLFVCDPIVLFLVMPGWIVVEFQIVFENMSW